MVIVWILQIEDIVGVVGPQLLKPIVEGVSRECRHCELLILITVPKHPHGQPPQLPSLYHPCQKMQASGLHGGRGSCGLTATTIPAITRNVWRPSQCGTLKKLCTFWKLCTLGGFYALY